MRLSHILCSLLLSLILLCGCRKTTKANWDVDVVIPLVNGHLSIKNFIGDSIFTPDNTGLLSLRVTREITSIKVDSLLSLPDTMITRNFTVIALQPLKLPPGYQLTFFPVTELEFDISNNVALKKVDIREGVLDIKFTNDLDQPLDILYLIPSAVKDAQPLAIKETVPPLPAILQKSYDLSGYSLNMRGLSGNVYNTIVQTCTITVNPEADSVQVIHGKGVHMDLTYKDIVPEYAEGYFGQQIISISPDTTRLNLINNFQATNFMLSDATLNFKILNEFGAEFTGNLSNIKSINSYTNNIVPLSTTQLANININRATRSGNTVFPSIKTASLTSSNSNIVPFLSNLPDQLSYQGSIQVNPLGNISGYNDFAFYDKGIRVLADIDIPMRFNASSFRLKSNAAVELSNIEQLDHVRSGNFVIQAENGYPFRARLQAYMLDAGGQIIDSLFVPGQNIIESGLLDNQNMVVSPYFSKVLVPIDAAKVSSMRRTRSIQIITYFLMPPNPPDIKIYENYNMDVSIIAELTYNVERN